MLHICANILAGLLRIGAKSADEAFNHASRLGRDDFNFLSWIVSASSYIVSVTERNSLDSMVLVWVVPHTQHKRYPCDRNFSKE